MPEDHDGFPRRGFGTGLPSHGPAVAHADHQRVGLMTSSHFVNLDAMDGSDMVYRMSKAALNAATVNLAMSLRPRRIRASAIDPGWMRTDMGGSDATWRPQATRRLDTDAQWPRAVTQGPSGHPGGPRLATTQWLPTSTVGALGRRRRMDGRADRGRGRAS